jgi:uncharacterized protein (TIRG00374 family)
VTAAPRLRPLLLAAALAISAAFLYVDVRGVDLELFLRAIRRSDPMWLVAAVVMLAGAVAVRVVRWRYLFDAQSRPGARAATRALLVGELFNSILPLRGGDVARIVVLHRDTAASPIEAGATVLAERLLDSLVLLLLVFATVPFAPEVAWLPTASALFAVIVAALVTVVIVVHVYGERPLVFLLRPIGRMLRFAPERVAQTAAQVVRGARVFRDVRTGASAFAMSIATWLAVAVSLWMAMRALHLHLGFDAAILLAAATTFALVIPAAPASVGVFEAAALVSLGPYHVGESRALACAVVVHVVTYVPFVLAGLLALRIGVPGPTQPDSPVPDPSQAAPPIAPERVRSKSAASRTTP